jgi:hypothetical protein
MSHFSVLKLMCVILVSSKFSIQNDVFMLFFSSRELGSHAVAGLWLWIAVVDDLFVSCLGLG